MRPVYKVDAWFVLFCLLCVFVLLIYQVDVAMPGYCNGAYHPYHTYIYTISYIPVSDLGEETEPKRKSGRDQVFLYINYLSPSAEPPPLSLSRAPFPLPLPSTHASELSVWLVPR